MGQLLQDRYEVLETVGVGGEARVAKALDRRHDRVVALKIRRVQDTHARDELLGEARILLAIKPHAALPLVREDFFDGDDYVVVMDWVDGTDLEKLLRDRGRPGLAPSSVLAYLAQAAEALTHLHGQDSPVIHGDVKPANLILARGGQVKLVDFGLSSAPDAPRRRAGTPGYRAPELAADGGAPSRPSDVYALAATAFALLTGAPPSGVLPAWEGIDDAQAQQLEAALRLGLATDPARRPATPGELVERLRAGWGAALPTGVLTFCLSDIEGSTALWDTDPEAMAEALVRHDELIADNVEARGGRFVKSMGEGDSTVSVFDSAHHALDAALAVTRALEAEDWPHGLRIADRFGLHTGEAERRGADYIGPTLNLAARLRGQADGGQIFLSSVTADLIAARPPAGCDLVDLGPHRLKGMAAPERIYAVSAPGVDAPPPVTHCPYRGLLAFEAEHRAFFFGREGVVADLVSRLAPGRLVALVGASGSGKSSVLRAGLAAAVEAGEVEGVNVVHLAAPGADARLDAAGVAEELVVVDQFEELFTAVGDDARRRTFVDALLALPGRVVIGVRADVYGQLSAYNDLARAVAGNQILLGAMTDDELRRAVTQPAGLAGLKLEPGLVELVLRDVAGEPGALPLLSHALRETWERRDGRTLTVDGYRESGGVASAVARTADSLVDSLPETRRGLVRNLFLRLTELGEDIEDSRRRVPIEELVSEGGSSDEVDALLEQLADARLVTLGEGTAEVAHEVLIREWPALRRWLDEDREGLRLHRRLGNAAHLWESGGKEDSDLYRGVRLTATLEWAQAHRTDLNATESAFLEESRRASDRDAEHQRRANRRLRGLLAGAAVFLVVALGAAALTLVQRERARDAESTAEAEALGSDAERLGAQALAEPNLDRALLLAVAGLELEDRPETRGNLLAALQKSPAALRVIRGSRSEIVALATSPGGELLASGDRAGNVRLIDTRTWMPDRKVVRLGQPILPRAMRFSPDGRAIAVATGLGESSGVVVIDARTKRTRRLAEWRGPIPQTPAGSIAIAYSPRGDRLAVAVPSAAPPALTPPSERLLLLEPSTGRTVWRRSYPVRRGQWEAHVEFTPRGMLLTSAQQGDTLVWSTRNGQITRRFGIGGKPVIARDGRTVALARNSPHPGNPNSSVAVLDLRTGKHRTLAARLPSTWITSLAVTPDGASIVGGSFTGDIRVWNTATGAISQTFVGQPGARAEIALDPAGQTVVSGSQDGSIVVWDLLGTRRLGRAFRWNRPEMSCPGAPCMVVNRQSTVMATNQGDGTIALVDLRRLRLTRTLPARNGPAANGMALMPDDRTLITGGIDGSVVFWDLQTRTVTRKLRVDKPVWWTAVSPNAKLLALQLQAQEDAGSRVEVRALPSGRLVRTHRLPFGASGLQFSPDGRTLAASGCCNGGASAAAWDAHTGAQLFRERLRVHAAAIAFSPDSRLLGIGTEDGKVLLWGARDGRQQGPPIPVAAGGVQGLSFSPDGRLFAVTAFDQTATLWDVRERKRIGNSFPIQTGAVPEPLFEPNGRLLLNYLSDAVEWPVDVRSWRRFACRVAARDLTRDEWNDVLPNRPYRRVCAE